MTPSTLLGGSRRPRGRLLYRGAEADVIRGEWQGLDAVYKVRVPLPYRHPALDETIRRQRTIREAEMLHQAKGAGVRAPYVYDVDVPGSTLVMEFVEGTRVKDLLHGAGKGDVGPVFYEFGRNTALLHAAGIMHGDLTTANVVQRGGQLVFLDFGLSVRTERVEDQAVDLRLIKETLVGAHASISQEALESLTGGYASVLGDARTRAVFKQLRGIERRGRYARVE